MRKLAAGLVLALTAAVPFASLAQPYPSKPIRLLTETAAGAAFDSVLRLVAQQMSQQLGQSVLVENRGGGNGVVSTEACARATADGYTLCTLSTSHLWNPHIFNKLPYDSEKDFRPISNLIYSITAIGVSGPTPANSIEELRKLAAAKPGALNWATFGEGSSPDLFRQELGEKWKTQFVAIHFKGGAPMIQAVMADDVQVIWTAVGNLAPAVSGGKARFLAMSSPKRLAQYPNVPTMTEAGVEPIEQVFYGLAAPAGVPEPILQRLNQETVAALRDPKLIEALGTRFMEPAPMTSSEFAAQLRTLTERAGAIARKYNVPKR